MSVELFMIALLFVSTLTSLVTEAVKAYLTEHSKEYSANTLAGWCALIVAVGLSICYVLYTGTIVTQQLIVFIIALIIMSWLCAMVGYDKVIQTLTQLSAYKKDGEK